MKNNRQSVMNKETAVILYSNLWLPHLSEATTQENEYIKNRVQIALDMSTFDKYQNTPPDKRIDFLKKYGHIEY